MITAHGPSGIRLGSPSFRRRQFNMRLTRVLFLALSIGMTALSAQGETGAFACQNEGITVEAGTYDQAQMLCDMAQEAVVSVSWCSLPQQRPIRIEVVEEIDHPFATCLAAYDCDYDRIRIVVRDDYASLVEPDDPYASFPPEVLLRTLLFHEIAHALIEQNSPDREVPLVDHEYIAAAMELSNMDAAWRDTIMSYSALEVPAEGRVNIWIYRLDPRRFAANAWLHFAMPQNGCDLVGRLIAGEATFDDQ
jgi:hypothetical protein